MNRFATSTILAGGLVATMVGMAGAAHADLSDTTLNQQQQQRMYVTPTANGVIYPPVVANDGQGKTTVVIVDLNEEKDSPVAG